MPNLIKSYGSNITIDSCIFQNINIVYSEVGLFLFQKIASIIGSSLNILQNQFIIMNSIFKQITSINNTVTTAIFYSDETYLKIYFSNNIFMKNTYCNLKKI